MRIALKKAVYENFKGLRSFTLDLGGQNAAVYGENASGKSSIMDGFLWVLTGKDSLDRANFEVKTLTPSGEAHHGLDHSVELTLNIDGQDLVLHRMLREKWTKTRGSANKVFSGHEQLFWIGDVPCNKTEFDNRVAEILPEETLKLLTSPAYFLGQLHWQKRREVLLSVCGDITDAEVIASDKSLRALTDILGDRSLEDHRKVIAARRKKINEELPQIAVRVDEAERALPDITGLDAKALVAEMEAMRAAVKDKNQQIARIESGGEIADKTRSLREIETKLLEIKNRYYAKCTALAQEKYTEHQDISYKAAGMLGEIKKAETFRDSCIDTIESKEAKMADLRAQWTKENERPFKHQETCTCPSCGQAIPEDQLDEARSKALAQFNSEKASVLEAIQSQGKRLASEVEELKGHVAEVTDRVIALNPEHEAAKKACAKLLAEVEALQADAKAYTNDPEYVEQMKGKELLESSIAELRTGSQAEVDAIRQEIRELGAQIASHDKKHFDIDRHAQGEQRIDELKAQERKLAAEYEKLESELFLSEEFVRAKVAALEAKINAKFKLARFKMFDTQVNGGISECCEATYNGVPYGAGLNNAMRINLGLDCINTLAEHYGVTIPVFIDNCEAIVEPLATRGQQIRLVVSGSDKALRVECERELAAVQGGLF